MTSTTAMDLAVDAALATEDGLERGVTPSFVLARALSEYRGGGLPSPRETTRASEFCAADPALADRLAMHILLAAAREQGLMPSRIVVWWAADVETIAESARNGDTELHPDWAPRVPPGSTEDELIDTALASIMFVYTYTRARALGEMPAA